MIQRVRVGTGLLLPEERSFCGENGALPARRVLGF